MHTGNFHDQWAVAGTPLSPVFSFGIVLYRNLLEPGKLRFWPELDGVLDQLQPPDGQTSVRRTSSVQNSPEETFLPYQAIILVTFVVSIWTGCPLDFVWFVCSAPLKTHAVFRDLSAKRRLHSFRLKAPFYLSKEIQEQRLKERNVNTSPRRAKGLTVWVTYMWRMRSKRNPNKPIFDLFGSLLPIFNREIL